ncbi:hypothetical protein HK405_011590 [Cladochytrium tenue]|nr:hypothetical protein HK405_011590 [Cladochytrium tenue]
MPHDHDPNTGGGEAGNRTVDVDLAVPAPLATGEGVSDVGGGLAEAGDVRFGQTNSILSAVGSGEVNGLVEEEERSIGNEGGDGDDDDVDDDDDDDDDDDEDTGDISEGERTSNIAVANHSRTRGVDVSRSESSDRVTCVGLLSRVRGIWMRPRGPGASYSTFSDNQRERHHLLADFIAFCATYPPGPSIPAALAILTFIVALPLTWLLFSHLTTMPTRVLDIHNTEISGSFSGSAAWAHLRNISARPHMYNSNGNLAVREFLVNRLQDFNLLAASRGRNNFLEFADDNVDLIVADGRLYFESNNVIVRIKGQSDSRSALLVSSHFDSTPVSYGTTDDGISVAVMLEFVRALIYNKPLAHDVILNFNNGEEMFLLGGQAFVYHPWFADIKAFINLEGTGSAPGTRSILFRTNSLDLMKKWKSGAPFPHASVLFNDMMSAVASATDYSAYVSYGGLQGVDIAFYTYRYLYHTQFDDVEHSQPISAQHMGENLLGFAMSVCDDGQLLDRLVPDTPNQPLSRTQPLPDFVFYDLFSSFTLNPGSKELIEIDIKTPRTTAGNIIELEGSFTGAPGSRICSIQVNHTLPISAVTADETFAVWILNSGKKGEWNWVVAGEGYLKERRDPRKAGTSRPTSFNMSKIPLEVTVARETWDDPANRRIRVPFLARFNATLATEVSRKSKRAAGIRPGDETDVVAEKSNDAGFQWVEVRCFLGETDASPFWQEHLRRGSNSSAAWPSWMTPAHGRYGGVAVSKRAPVPKQEL